MTTDQQTREPEGAHPNDIAPRAGFSSAQKAAWVLVVATLTTLVFNPNGLVEWTATLPGNAFADFIYDIAMQWTDRMETLGLTEPFESIRGWFRAFQAWEWPAIGPAASVD
jgi:hypothetical protein